MAELKKVAAEPALTIKDVTAGLRRHRRLADAARFRRGGDQGDGRDPIPACRSFPAMASGASDSMWFRYHHVPSYGASPIFIKASEDFSHGLNERTPIANIAPRDRLLSLPGARADEIAHDKTHQRHRLPGPSRRAGLASASEFWERFSYYGMQALLVLYMTHYLLLPGHIEQRLGFDAVPAPARNASMASRYPARRWPPHTYGFYAGFVYLTPIGGRLARRPVDSAAPATVTIGAILMALGHFLMAFDASFLLALACLLVGVGCFKGNIAAQVGDLYARRRSAPRRRLSRSIISACRSR